MPDKGWTFSHATRAWELLGPDGEVISTISAAYVEQYGAADLNAFGARQPRLWPPLRPGRPYVHCVLGGGPSGVVHRFFDPDEADGPPDHVILRGLAYRRSPQQGCGHGGDCGYWYAAAEAVS